MCKCIKILSEKGYVLPNLLNPDQVFLCSVKNGRVTKTSYCQVNYCPCCGKPLGEATAEAKP